MPNDCICFPQTKFKLAISKFLFSQVFLMSKHTKTSTLSNVMCIHLANGGGLQYYLLLLRKLSEFSLSEALSNCYLRKDDENYWLTNDISCLPWYSSNDERLNLRFGKQLYGRPAWCITNYHDTFSLEKLSHRGKITTKLKYERNLFFKIHQLISRGTQSRRYAPL